MFNVYSEFFTKQFIGGRWVDSASAELTDVENPALMQPFAKIPAGCPADAEAAIEAAAAALPAWSGTTVEKRIALMQKLFDAMTEASEAIAALETDELGAPAQYARKKHCDYQLSRIPAYIEQLRTIDFEYRRTKAFVRVEPVGVVSCITPWNYPLGQIIQKVVPAILMGNTVVLKPSSHAPLTAVVLAECFRKAGFPAGVFNLVSGVGSSMGDTLASHPKVAMVSFTGSTALGRKLGAIAGANLKKVNLELGGKSPCVWLPGMSDYEPACRTLFNSAFLNAGQTCTSLSRLIMPESMLPQVRELFQKLLPRYKTGNPLDTSTVVGPVISRAQYDRVSDYIRLGCEEGAELFAGKIPPANPVDGYFIDPVIFMNVKPDMRIAQEEIFGPVLCVLTYKTIEEAIEIANGTPYGLSALLYGPIDEVRALAARIDSGNVFLNDAPRDITAPFSGFKASGLGCESGREGLLEFARLKSVFDGVKITR